MASFFRTQRSTALSSNRSGTDQRIHDELSLTVQKMMRHPTNKRCADCLAPNPKFVNIELRTFICESCGRIHADFQKKKVSIRFASSNLTKNELLRLRHPNAGNEAVNSIFMAKYNHQTETLEHPDQFSNSTTRKNWIYYKYVKRTWCMNRPLRPPAAKPPQPPRQNIPSMKPRLLPPPNRARSDSASSVGSSVRLVRTHEVIVRLHSLSSNKRCADCAIKKVRYVNLTHKSFICTPCAVVHSKQLGHEVKEIGCDDFSSKDIQRMSGSDVGNDYLNACYLALYDPVKEIDTPPNGGSTLTFRLAWMMKKYASRTWYKEYIPARSMVQYAGTSNPYSFIHQNQPVNRGPRSSQSWDNQSLSSHDSSSRMSVSLNSNIPRPQQVPTQEYEIDVNRPFRKNPEQNLPKKRIDMTSSRPRDTTDELEVDFNGNVRRSRSREPYEPVNVTRNDDRIPMNDTRSDMRGSRGLPIDASFRINQADIRKAMSSSEVLKQDRHEKQFRREMEKTDSLPLDFKFQDNGPNPRRGLPIDASFRIGPVSQKKFVQNESIPEKTPFVPPVQHQNPPPSQNMRSNQDFSPPRSNEGKVQQELDVDFNGNRPKRSQNLPLNQIFGQEVEEKHVPILNPSRSRKNNVHKQKKVSFQIPEDQGSKDSSRSSDSDIKEKNPQDPEFSSNPNKVYRRIHQQLKPKRKEDQRIALGGLLRR